MKIILLFYICAFSLSIAACAKPSPSVQFIHTASQQVIAPAYDRLHQQSIAFAEQAKSCKQTNPDYDAVFNVLNKHWKHSMSAWQAVQWVQFGPIKQEGREWALQFWPDKKNLVGRKIKKRLTNSEMMTEADLDSEGVVVQGLSALEYLLYDEQAKKLFTASQRCLSIVSIVNKVKQVSGSLHRDWLIYHDNNFVSIDKPQALSEIDSPAKGVSILVNNIIGMLDNVVGKKIASPFSLAQSDTKKVNSNAYFLESWRSQTSLDNVKQNILSLQTVLLEGGLIELLQFKEPKAALILTEKLHSQLNVVLHLLENDWADSSFFMSISQAKPESEANIKSLYIELVSLRRLIKIDLSEILGVQLGFNSSDGDS
ncbi:MAG: imelysin family protein [Cellvibrionaceae bacterium]